MFENLSDRLGGVFDRLTKQGALSEDDVTAAMREVRVALLEADVSLPVARSFVKSVTAKATGAAVTKSVTPGQQVVKIVHDELIKDPAGRGRARCAAHRQPAGADPDGRAAGLGQDHDHGETGQAPEGPREKARADGVAGHQPPRRDGAAGDPGPADRRRYAADRPGENAVQIAKRAKQQATLGGYDVYMLDTAGRLHIDQVLMDEVQAVRDVANPRETLLVVDGLTGQDAVNVATEFDGKVGITGVVLTRMDGDGRGGAALSMRAVTGKPIRFVGLGEKMDALETFDAQRVAGRILGMGDIVALVEKAQEVLEVEQAERMMKRFQKGQFNMNDLKNQLEQMQKMGGMQSIMGMMPGMGKMAKQAEAAGFDDKAIRRQVALINSMTKRNAPIPTCCRPAARNASRRRRHGCGRTEPASEDAEANG
jgi:signal recognition particle subunit SRP54